MEVRAIFQANFKRSNFFFSFLALNKPRGSSSSAKGGREVPQEMWPAYPQGTPQDLALEF